MGLQVIFFFMVPNASISCLLRSFDKGRNRKLVCIRVSPQQSPLKENITNIRDLYVP
jgi:hypothetical protein